jgi:hypothetical protein
MAKRKKRLTHADTLESCIATCWDNAGREHQTALGLARDALHHALKVGFWLSKAKGLKEHGTWGKWLDDWCQAFHVSAETARHYMRVWKNYHEVMFLAKTGKKVTIAEVLDHLRIPREPKPKHEEELTEEQLERQKVEAGRKYILSCFEDQLKEWTDWEILNFDEYNDSEDCLEVLRRVPYGGMDRDELFVLPDDPEDREALDEYHREQAEEVLQRRRSRRRRLPAEQPSGIERMQQTMEWRRIEVNAQARYDWEERHAPEFS